MIPVAHIFAVYQVNPVTINHYVVNINEASYALHTHTYTKNNIFGQVYNYNTNIALIVSNLEF